MSEIFAQYKVVILFLHVLSAVVWVGGMIAMRYAAHYSFLEIETPKIRLERISHALKRLFNIVLPFVIILIVTAVFMIKGYELSNSQYAALSHAKEGIWSLMFLNLIVMMRRRARADRALKNGDIALAKEQLGFIGKFQVPANIILGVIAILIGTIFSSTF